MERGSLCRYGLEEGPCAGMDWKRVPVQIWIGRGSLCGYALGGGFGLHFKTFNVYLINSLLIASLTSYYFLNTRNWILNF